MDNPRAAYDSALDVRISIIERKLDRMDEAIQRSFEKRDTKIDTIADTIGTVRDRVTVVNEKTKTLKDHDLMNMEHMGDRLEVMHDSFKEADKVHKDKLRDFREKQEKLDKRLRNVEIRVWIGIGIATAIMTAISEWRLIEKILGSV